MGNFTMWPSPTGAPVGSQQPPFQQPPPPGEPTDSPPPASGEMGATVQPAIEGPSQMPAPEQTPAQPPQQQWNPWGGGWSGYNPWMGGYNPMSGYNPMGGGYWGMPPQQQQPPAEGGASIQPLPAEPEPPRTGYTPGEENAGMPELPPWMLAGYDPFAKPAVDEGASIQPLPSEPEFRPPPNPSDTVKPSVQPLQAQALRNG